MLKKRLQKYGKFDWKDRKKYLFDNENIIINRFTNKSSDYLKNDIIKNIIKFNKINDKKIINSLNKKKKIDLFYIIQDIIENFKKYDINKIIILQSYIRRFLILDEIKLRGPAFLNKKLCNNDSDFYFMLSPQEIDNNYFFSYKNDNNIIWFFDIRSIYKLISLNQDNPYTRESIPENVKFNINKLIHKLNNKNINISIDEEIIGNNIKQIKQKMVNIVSILNQFGYDCNINWFLDLDLILLKKLYRCLEDIWNYRIGINEYIFQMKCRIIPPDGKLFTLNNYEIHNIQDIYEIQNYILNDVLKLLNTNLNDDKNLGCIYFLIGLSEVNPICYNYHRWLSYI